MSEEKTVEKESYFDINDVVAYCHLFHGRPVAVCGVPRREQPKHNGWCPSDGFKFCPIDGLKVCPKCSQRP